MKIALCSKGNFSLEKGFTKNRIELAESLEKLGWETLLVDKQMLGIPSQEKYNAKSHSAALKDFLKSHSNEFDVILYEYDTLPFDRSIFSKNTLFVARPAILDYHQSYIKFRYDLKTRISHLFRYVKDGLLRRTNDPDSAHKHIQYCLNQSDLIQVQNKIDRKLLITQGFPAEKIIIIPNGISSERMASFNNYPRNHQEPFSVAFVGTFDYRKGAMDFSGIFRLLKKRFPSIRLKLLGTRGIFYSVDQVLKFFPKKFHSDIEVIPKFNADELPQLLSDCHIGIFPSYLESFGFGALEMMCAGLPVVAYDVPGPSDFVLSDLLVPSGDFVSLSQKIISLLESRELLEQKSQEAKDLVLNHYCWDDIAKNVDISYRYHRQKLQQVSLSE